MTPNWSGEGNNTFDPCDFSRTEIKVTANAELSKAFISTAGVDIRAGRYAIPLTPVEINIFALNTDNFTQSLVDCWKDDDKNVKDIKSLCEHVEVSWMLI